MCVIVVCLACGAADLGESEIDTEREGFIGQMRLEFVDYLEVYEQGTEWYPARTGS